jgi:hypothetical protein
VLARYLFRGCATARFHGESVNGRQRSSDCGSGGATVTGFTKVRVPWSATLLDIEHHRAPGEVLTSDRVIYAPPLTVVPELWGQGFDVWRWAHLLGPAHARPETSVRNATVREVLAEVGGTHAWFLVQQTCWAIRRLREPSRDRVPIPGVDESDLNSWAYVLLGIDAEEAALRLEDELFAAQPLRVWTEEG